MFRNYFNTALRALIRQRAISTINIVGFSIGLAVCFLIVSFVSGQLSYDKWMTEGDRVYRLESTTKIPGRAPKPQAQTNGIAHNFLLEDFPEIESVVRLLPLDTIFYSEGTIAEQEIYEVDEEFFKVFPLEFEVGNAETALPNINSFVMTRTAANVYFGPNAKIGDTVEINHAVSEERMTMQLTGILKDLPENTHLNLEVLGRFDPQRYAKQRWIGGTWFSRNLFTYFKLQPNANIDQINSRLEGFINKRVDISNSPFADMKAMDLLSLSVINFQDIFLKSDTGGQMGPVGSMDRVYGFVAIAALVLIIASINFINMTTARASLRAKEVSLRRIAGASRKQLIVQYLGEALLVSIIAFLFALVIVELSLPWFNTLVGSGGMTIEKTGQLFSIFALIALVTGVISGLYPAFILSSYRPVEVLTSGQAETKASGRMRTALVIIQFGISVALISATLIVKDQLQLTTSMDLGYRADNMLVIQTHSNSEVAETLKKELSRRSDVTGVTMASSPPTSERESQNSLRVPSPEGPVTRMVSSMRIDYDFFQTMEINLVAGRFLNEEIASDKLIRSPEGEEPAKLNIIINQSAIPLLGYKNAENAIGQSLTIGESRPVEIVGVVEDIVYRSVRTAIRPTMYFNMPNAFSVLMVRTTEGVSQNVIGAAQSLWGSLRPDLPFNYSDLGEEINRLYAPERQQMRLLTLFAILAILVATLGVFGLALFTAERKAKEVAIRKVFGARILDIIHLLSWKFSKPVLLANLLAWPTVWYLMNKWLENFAYRVDVDVMALLIPSILALFVAWLTVGGHALKVARTNPIKALRAE